jgi:hypothetical protein
MIKAKNYLFFGLPLLLTGIILLAVSLPQWVTTSPPPRFAYMGNNYDAYHFAFYLSLIGGFILACGLICVGIYKSVMKEKQEAESK